MLQQQFNAKKNQFQNQSVSGIGTLFSIQDATIEYGKIKALDNVQFKVSLGEIVFLTGASGAGKTTLLKLLAGHTDLTKGKIKRPGADNFVSMIFQDHRFIERKSCEDNLWVSYDPKIYRSKNEFHKEMMEFAEVLGIKDRLGLKIKDANGGLKQKVAFIRAMLCRPSVIIADEPTSSLDYENAKKIYDILNLYNTKRGLTVIWASHNKDLVKKFNGRIVHIDKGKIIYSGHACFI
ncbi:MAG: ATP-binding cassette domain-containing protein [Oligoflexia bacterium]|nr:ATP-binding cassette domain-containing protein [Oligoflexia bacterium]